MVHARAKYCESAYERLGQVRCACKTVLGSSFKRNGVTMYQLTNVRLVRLVPYASGLRTYRYLIDSTYERPAQILCENSFHVPVFANITDTHGEYHDLKITVSQGLTMYSTSQLVQFGFRTMSPLKNVPNPSHSRKNSYRCRSSKNGNILKISRSTVGACRKDLRKVFDEYSRRDEQESEAETSSQYQDAPIQLPDSCNTPEIERMSKIIQEIASSEESSDEDIIDLDKIIDANVSMEQLTNSANHQLIDNMPVEQSINISYDLPIDNVPSPMMPQFEPDVFDINTYNPFDDFSSINDLNGIFGLP